MVTENDDAMRRAMRVAGQTAVGLLVKGEFEVLEAMTSGRHLSAEQLRWGVDDLGGRLVEPPAEAWPDVASTPGGEGASTASTFVVPLWTVDGPTTTGVRLHLDPTEYGTFDVQIEGFVPVEASAGRHVARPQAPTSVIGGGGGDRSSTSPVPERWRPMLAEIVRRLVVGDYAGLAADGLVSYTDDPTDTSIGRWIEEYPAHLVDLPAAAWAHSEHGPTPGRPDSWWVTVDLWTAEEGRSDLTMEATVWDDGRSVTAKVDNVHVM